MTEPLKSKDVDPVRVTVRGKAIEAWAVPAVGVHSGPEDARVTIPFWTIKIDGVARKGPDINFAKDNDLSGVTEMLERWADQYPELFSSRGG